MSNLACEGDDCQGLPGTIKQLAAAGFQTIELCSPVGYADSGFAGLAKYTGTSYGEFWAMQVSPV